MGVVFTPLPPGLMVASLLETELARLRAWTNGGIVAGDQTAATIRAIHILRPQAFGFPLEAQHGASGNILCSTGEATDSTDIRAQVRRFDMSPKMPLRFLTTNLPMTAPIGKLSKTWDVWYPTGRTTIRANWSAFVGTTATSIRYHGYFQLHYKNDQGVEAIITSSKRTLQASTAQSARFQRNSYSTQGEIDVVRGKYTAWVDWVPSDAYPPELVSVAIGAGSITCVTHRT